MKQIIRFQKFLINEAVEADHKKINKQLYKLVFAGLRH